MTSRRLRAGVLLAAAVCAAPLAAAPREWLEAKSPNFTVYTDAGSGRGREVAVQFEQIRAAFERLWKGARTRSPLPVVILAARDERSWKELVWRPRCLTSSAPLSWTRGTSWRTTAPAWHCRASPRMRT